MLKLAHPVTPAIERSCIIFGFSSTFLLPSLEPVCIRDWQTDRPYRSYGRTDGRARPTMRPFRTAAYSVHKNHKKRLKLLKTQTKDSSMKINHIFYYLLTWRAAQTNRTPPTNTPIATPTATTRSIPAAKFDTTSLSISHFTTAVSNFHRIMGCSGFELTFYLLTAH